MLRLIQLEWLKFAKNKVIWVMVLLFAIILPSKLLIGSKIENIPPPLPGPEIFSEFPTVWDFLAYNGSWQVFFFMGFLAIYIVTLEFGNKTAKQSIIQGLSRKEFYWSKVSSIVLMSIMVTIYFVAVGLITGMTYSTDWEWSQVWGDDAIIPRFFLMCLGYTSFAYLIGIVFRKTGLSLLIYFAYVLFLEPVFRWVVHTGIVEGNSQFFYPMNAVEDLCPLPFYEMIPDFVQQGQTTLYILTPLEASIASFGYIVVFFSLAYYLLIRRDF